MSDEQPIDETRGLGLVGMAMSVGILSRLEAKGVLTKTDVDEVLEGILSSLEDFQGPNDPGIRSARVLVDAIAQIASMRRRPTPSR